MKKSSPSISVRRSLEKLGQDIRLARLRRDLTMQLVFGTIQNQPFHPG